MIHCSFSLLRGCNRRWTQEPSQSRYSLRKVRPKLIPPVFLAQSASTHLQWVTGASMGFPARMTGAKRMTHPYFDQYLYGSQFSLCLLRFQAGTASRIQGGGFQLWSI